MSDLHWPTQAERHASASTRARDALLLFMAPIFAGIHWPLFLFFSPGQYYCSGALASVQFVQTHFIIRWRRPTLGLARAHARRATCGASGEGKSTGLSPCSRVAMC